MFEIGRRHNLEVRESQLWWLAVLVIVLLALALLVVDMANVPDRWWFCPQLEFALNTRVMRAGLIVSTLVICAYFRDSARRLRRENSVLIHSLSEYSRQLEKKNDEISRLKGLSDQLIGLADLQKALDLVLGMAVEMIGADTASIMLRDKDSDSLRILASHGLSPEIAESTRICIGERIAGLVAQERKAVILNSDELTGEMARRAFRSDTIASSVLAPIQIGEDVCGVVSVAKRSGGDCFTEEDLGVLSALANQAALAIQKHELLDDLRNQVDILAATLEELRQTQAELIQSEKLASIGQLAGGVAHEINNPLQVILGRIGLLIERETDESKAESLKCVIEHVTRIADIVSNLLSFSRHSSGTEFQEVDVNTVIAKTLGLLEPQMALDDIAIIKDFGKRLGTASGNAGQLQQVFTNIVLNSYQAMVGQGGGALKVRTRRKSNFVKIQFDDTGPGIPGEYLERLFEPFFTTKAEGEGTGLGLAIAYGIIQSHGGILQAQNNPDRGARFTICLPVSQRTSGGSP